jgi:predicted amidohydrolase YtcJ
MDDGNGQDKDHISRRALLRTGAVTGAAAAAAAGSIAAAGVATAATSSSSASARRSTSPARDLILCNGLNALGKQINPGQQLTRPEVLDHFTVANQWFLGGHDEHLLGSLEPGRLGDVVVLSEDYFTVPASALRSLHSVLTVVGGAVVHSGPVEYWA